MPSDGLNLAQALGDVLAGVEAGAGSATIGYDAVAAWDATALDKLIARGLLKPSAAAQSIECHGCEERCFSEVVVRSTERGDVRAFVVCEVSHMRAEMGRVPVHPERLRQWRSTTELLARFIAQELNLANDFPARNSSEEIKLGMLKGPNGRRWVTLLTAPLVVEVNQQSAPVSELLFVDAGEIVFDTARIQSLLQMPTGGTGKQYTPSTSAREARKSATQAMYQDWQDAYDELSAEHPGRTKQWYAFTISKMPVARGRDADTIRKNVS